MTLSGAFSFALAQESPSQKLPTPLQTKTISDRVQEEGSVYKDRFIGIKASSTEVRKEQKALSQSKRKDVIQRFSLRMLTQLNEHVNNIEKLALRIDTRIGKLEDDGYDMSEARKYLVTAGKKIDIARGKIKEAASKISSILKDTNSKNSFEAVQSAIKDAEGSVKNARQSLIDTITSIKISQEPSLEAPPSSDSGTTTKE